MRHQANALDIPQHPADLVMHGQPLLRPQTLHPIERQVHMVGETLGLLPAGVGWANRSALTVKAGSRAPELGRRLVQQRWSHRVVLHSLVTHDLSLLPLTRSMFPLQIFSKGGRV
jgi:hypothetical protein